MTGPARQYPAAPDGIRLAPVPDAGANVSADIVELIMADHRRIGRLCRAVYDTARQGGSGPSSRSAASITSARNATSCLLPADRDSGDVEASKPAPDLVEVALGKADVPAEQAVFTGARSGTWKPARKPGSRASAC